MLVAQDGTAHLDVAVGEVADVDVMHFLGRFFFLDWRKFYLQIRPQVAQLVQPERWNCFAPLGNSALRNSKKFSHGLGRTEQVDEMLCVHPISLAH